MMTMRLDIRRVLGSALLISGAGALAACGDDGSGPRNVPPTTVTATVRGANAVRVSWNAVGGASGYLVDRAIGGTGTFARVTASPITATQYDDEGLAPGTLYRYQVKAIVGRDTSIASIISQATTSAAGGASATINQDITTSRTLYADTVYTLDGYVHVLNGATLTIQPGTKIVGKYSTLGSSLFIMKGAKINAVGTAAAPIVFTSEQPAGSRRPGDWGGLVIVGQAPINRSGDIEVEGTGTASGTTSGANYRVLYGTNGGNGIANDNSGTLKYVRVEFAGYAPSLNNELNAFTFAAVGSGTRASYLQAMAGLDDAFEFFGGGFDADHLVSYEAEDDNFDMSEGFSGRLQYLVAYASTQLAQRSGAGTPASDPQGIENDGCNGTGCDAGFNSTPFTVPMVANFTLVGTGSTASSGSSGGIGMMLRRGTGGYYVNGIVARYPRAGVSLRDSLTFVRAGSAATPDLATTELAVRNLLFADVPVVFQSGTGQYAFDLAGNGLVNSAATTASLFTAFPTTVDATTTETVFDWRPAPASAAATGGLATFTGKLATKAGTFVTGTSYVGAAAPGGDAWWNGWTIYRQN